MPCGAGQGPLLDGTWQTYQHVVVGMQTDAAEKVAALIFGPSDRHLKLVSCEGDDQPEPGPIG